LVVLLHMPLGTDGERELLARCPAVVTSSRWVGARLVEAGVHPDRVTVAEPGVDPADAVPGSPDGAGLLAAAVLAPHKGQDVLVAALHRLTDLAWTCTVAGALDVDPDFAARVCAAAAGLGDRIRFVGPLAGADLARAYASADLLVHPSRQETYGMVITEALARGIPVVASDVGGIPVALGRDPAGARPGCLVASGDVDALAAALRGWLTDPGVRADWRRAAAARRPTLAGWSSTAAALAGALAGTR
jgi:glycosyltransferase involved in cell wall biosynthesis